MEEFEDGLPDETYELLAQIFHFTAILETNLG
jgi:type III secretion system FlhB-like substrate exporter